MASQRILLVEGTDDEHVLKHICGNRGIPHVSGVIPHGGAQPLLESIPVRLKASDERGNVFGVVMDADTDVAARWQSIHDRLIQAGYTDVPAQPDPSGTILDPPPRTLLPRVGVWIMPDNKTSGILEDFLAFLVPQPNDLFGHAAHSVDAIPNPLFPKRTILRPSCTLGWRGKRNPVCLLARLSLPASSIPGYPKPTC